MFRRVILSFFMFVCLSLTFLSCGSRKEVSDLRIDVDTMRRIEAIVNSLTEERTVDVRRSELNGDITIREIEFDTDKPIDPETGERPVIRETETNIRIENKDSVAVIDTLSRKDNVDISRSDNDDVVIDSEIEKEKKESMWPTTIAIIASLGILIAFIVILNKFNLFKKK